MSVEAEIHRRWAACGVLTRLVPPDRFCTGRMPASDALGRPIGFPYVVLHGDIRPEALRTIRTSAGTLLVATLYRFDVYAVDVEQARRIAHAIVNCFQGAEFAWEEGRVQDCRPGGQLLEQLDGGGWRLSREFTIRYETRA